jgi:hypothetical protein
MKIEYTIKVSNKKRTLSNVTFVDQSGQNRELTYWLHDYGRLAYWMRKYGKITGDPLWDSLMNVFEIDEFFEGPPNPTRKKWYLWHLSKLAEIEVTEKIGTDTYKLGTFGRLAFEAAKMSSGRVSWSEAMENIVITRLIAKRLENFGCLLNEISGRPLNVCCISSPRDCDSPKGFSIEWADITTTLKDAYLVLAEPPNTAQELKASTDPLILSTFLINEIYYSMSNLREKIVRQVAETGSTVNPYILADRGSYEIKRALERLGILRRRLGYWYTSLPDKLLSSTVWYALVKAGKSSISLREFADILKEDFRFILEPDDVTEFLLKKVKNKELGIDLNVLRNNLERNYSKMLERLVDLGFASIRPDGEAIIEAA